jgi:hypothetical protein
LPLQTNRYMFAVAAKLTSNRFATGLTITANHLLTINYISN